ncbi:MAG: hypothetical protein IKI34_02755 [Eubacterium sp.]|nr:hypothetical protein [Eubacterium sp.]
MKKFLVKIGEFLKKAFVFIKEGFKNKILPWLREFLKKPRVKQGMKIAGIAVLAVALIFGGIKLISFSKTAYLRPYIKEYNIEFPKGILEEMCDEYGKDQSIVGRVDISDIPTEKYVSGKEKENCLMLEKGGNIEKEQHFRAICYNEASTDLESLYSTANLFLKSSQTVSFTTLFDKEEYKVVAAFYTNTKPEDDNGYLFPYNFCGNMSEKDFKAYEDRIVHRTLYNTGYEFSYDDYFLTLSEPSDFMKDFRFVVVCVKAGKRGVQKSDTATPNEKIHFPQVWYDENNEQNPYIFAGKWYPKAF